MLLPPCDNVGHFPGDLVSRDQLESIQDEYLTTFSAFSELLSPVLNNTSQLEQTPKALMITGN